jgi:2,4-dienoyl-CoA reductase-like NADH-dependent reductase (Old Yellow Enzyme family)
MLYSVTERNFLRMAFELLAQPLTIKKTTFPNRVVLAPIQTNYATEDGEATERLIKFHENIAKSDVGLSIVGATGITPTGKLGKFALALYEDRHIESARKLFDAIKKAGSVPAVQLNHGGRLLSLKLAGGDVVGPSAIASPMAETAPRELTTEEVEEFIGRFVHSIEAAKTAGAAMVEIHAAHSYLLNQFLSPAANRRMDQYGGSTEKRGRIVREILEKARERVGDDFILGLRMSVEEYVDEGLTVGESVELIKMFIASGLDIIHVSAGGMDSGPRMIQEAGKGNILKLAGEIKQDIGIPVIAVGGIIALEQAEDVLKQGLADMVALGRAFIADPEIVKKTLEGKVDDVNECTTCLQCFAPGSPNLTCSVNDDI